MNFYPILHAKYRPEISMKEFSNIMNELENELFDAHPKYLQLSERIQNCLIVQYYRKKYHKGLWWYSVSLTAKLLLFLGYKSKLCVFTD